MHNDQRSRNCKWSRACTLALAVFAPACVNQGDEATSVVDSALTITSSTRLTQNIFCTENPCVEITAPSVTLDGAHKFIDCQGQDTGVFVTSGGAFATIKNLELRNCGVGIVSQAGGTQVTSVSAHDNSTGIRLEVENYTVSRVKLADNTSIGIFLGAAGTVGSSTILRSPNGIAVISAAANVNNNTLKDCAIAGINVQNATGGNITGNRVTGSGTAGVSVFNTTGLTITGNTASRNQVGIEVTSGSTGNLITNNVATNNAIVDLADDNGSCAFNTWSGNRFGTADPACIQ